MSGPSYSGSASFFNDSSTASGISAANHPGIAVDNSSTMGGYWLLKAPGGKSYVTQQIDWGPNPSLVAAGRPIDLSEPLANAIGFDKNAGVQAGYSVTFLGHGINDVASALGKLPGDLSQLQQTGLQSLSGQVTPQAAPSAMPGSPSPAAQSGSGSTASTQFDQAAYDQAKSRYVLGSYLSSEAKINPWEQSVPGAVRTTDSVLGSGLATTTTPNPNDFTQTVFQQAQSTLQSIAGGTPLAAHPNVSSQGFGHPFPSGWQPSRLDMGFDGTFHGQIHAPISGTITYASSSFSNWGGYIVLKADHQIPGLNTDTLYFAEGISPTVHAGQRVNVGDAIANPGNNPFNGIQGNIEWGPGISGQVGSPTDPLAKQYGLGSSGARSMVLAFASWAQKTLGLAGPTNTGAAGSA